jgi:hypothetical protein
MEIQPTPYLTYAGKYTESPYLICCILLTLDLRNFLQIGNKKHRTYHSKLFLRPINSKSLELGNWMGCEMQSTNQPREKEMSRREVGTVPF